MRQEGLNAPTPQQVKYLGYLLSRAHELGMPHLDIDKLSRAQVSAWIDFLASTVVRDLQREAQKEAGANSSSPLPVRPGTYRYRPALGETVSDHLHEIEPWGTEDGWEILECVTCGNQW